MRLSASSSAATTCLLVALIGLLTFAGHPSRQVECRARHERQTSGSSTRPATTLASSPAATSATSGDEEEQPATSTVDSMSVNMEDGPAAIGAAEESSTPSASGQSPDVLESRSIDAASSEQNSADEKPGSGDKPSRRPSKADDANSHRLNLTQIDQIYTSSFKSEQEVVESWQRMGRKMKKGVSNIISSLVPMALNMTQEARISSNCTGAMLKWVLSMNQLKLWALRMLDASGKPVAGLLEGSMTLFGNYRQCLKVRAPDDDEIEFAGEFREYFRGKYCVIQAKPWLPEKGRFYNLNSKIKALMETVDADNAWYEKTAVDELSEWALAFNFVNIRMDLCMPSLCSREDIQKTINFITQGIDLRTRVLRCETAADHGPYKSLVESSDSEPLTAAAAAADTELPASHIVHWLNPLGWFLVPLALVCLVLVASVLSFALDERASSIRHLRHTIRSLSLARSVSGHLNVDYGQLADDKPLALYGIRFILVLWVVLVESAVNLKFEFLRELLPLKELIFAWPLQIVINSTLQFDSFILLAAFTLAYKNCLNHNSLSNARSLLKYVLDKYVRLMPSVMLMVASVTALPYLYSGPVWNDYVARQAQVCRSNGWLNSVFLQNYLPYKEICLPQSWLLCVELQLVVLLSPLVYYLNASYMRRLNEGSRSSNKALFGEPATGKQSKQDEAASDEKRVQSSSGGSLWSFQVRAREAHRSLYWLFTVPGLLLLACVLLGTGASFYNVYANQLPPSWFYTMPDPDSKSLYFSAHLTQLWAHLAVFALGILAGVECRRASRNALRASHQRKSGNLMGSSLLDMPYKDLKSRHSAANSTSSCCSLPVLASDSTSVGLSGNLDGSSSVTINLCQYNEARKHHKTDLFSRANNKIDLGEDASQMNQAANNSSGSHRSVILQLFYCMMLAACMLLIIFSTHEWSINDLPQPLVAGLFDAASRFGWSMAMICILYMVSVPSSRDGRLSLAARLLGKPLMVSLGKLSFLIYIIYPFVHMTVLAIQEQPIYSSWLMLFHILVGNLTITVILAYLVSLFIEMPCRNLFRRCETSILLASSNKCLNSDTSSA